MIEQKSGTERMLVADLQTLLEGRSTVGVSNDFGNFRLQHDLIIPVAACATYYN